MIIFCLIYGCIACLYLWFLVRLEASWQDRLVVVCLRTLVLIAVGFLLFSPRFESIHKIWKDPFFLVLEDDSISSSESISATKLDYASVERELSGRGRVFKRKFSEFGADQPFSIQSNLTSALKLQNLRGIFLISDGQEISESQLGQYPIPIFPLPQGPQSSRDYWVNLEELPRQVNLNQKIRIKGSIGRSDINRKLNKQQVKVTLSLGNSFQYDQLVSFEAGDQIAYFTQDLEFTEAGDVLVDARIEVQDQDTLKINNLNQVLVQVGKKLRKVVLIGDELGMDKAFYLRILRQDPSLDVRSFYLRSKYPEVSMAQCENLEESELLILHAVEDKFYKDCVESRYDQIPRIHFIDPGNVILTKNQLGAFFEDGSGNQISNTLFDGIYRLNSNDFPALKLYEHEAYQKTLLSSLPEVRSFLMNLNPKVGIKVPFYLERQEQQVPLLLVKESGNPVSALFTSVDLHRTSFTPWTRPEQKLFMSRLFRRLVTWMLDYQKIGDLNVFIPHTALMQGQVFVMNLSGTSTMNWKITGVGSQADFVRQGTTPVNFREVLPVGNYILSIIRDGQEVSRQSINVNYDPAEFKAIGINTQALKELARLSSGQWMENNGSVDAKAMIESLSGNLLQKKLELRRDQVDLQKSFGMAIFIMFLLGLEWIYRFIRKMV